MEDLHATRKLGSARQALPKQGFVFPARLLAVGNLKTLSVREGFFCRSLSRLKSLQHRPGDHFARATTVKISGFASSTLVTPRCDNSPEIVSTLRPEVACLVVSLSEAVRLCAIRRQTPTLTATGRRPTRVAFLGCFAQVKVLVEALFRLLQFLSTEGSL